VQGRWEREQKRVSIFKNNWCLEAYTDVVSCKDLPVWSRAQLDWPGGVCRPRLPFR
jgi:hypothetical protein